MGKIIPPAYRSWFAFIAFVATVFLLVKVVLPAFSEAKELFNAKAEREAKLSQRESALAALRGFAASFNALEAGSRSAVDSAVPEELDFSEWLATLESIAVRSGVYVDVLEQRGSASSDMAEFVVRLRGSYSATKLFLSMLGQNIRLTDIRDLRLESGSGTDRDPILQANVTLAIYYQP